ncbi:phosphonate C-P lyase system protein PhnH [Patescibacteria group bacterium]|nr:phosphonate C-P lyase system protein PhnH [Patescibacteria group bacterium]
MNEFDNIFDSQKTFRKLLEAFSFPGRIISLEAISATEGLEFLYPIFMTLFDHETCFYLYCVDETKIGRISNYIGQKTGSKIRDVGDSDFIVLLNEPTPELIKKIKTGDIEYPEDGATVISYVKNITNNSTGGIGLVLSGPGIKEETYIAVDGLSEVFFRTVNEHQDYPCGVDIIFVDSEGRLAVIPRSVKMEVKAWGL